MGIFDFFKSSDKRRNKNNEINENNINTNVNQPNRQIRREIYDIVNNESEVMEKNLKCLKRTGLIRNYIQL